MYRPERWVTAFGDIGNMLVLYLQAPKVDLFEFMLAKIYVELAILITRSDSYGIAAKRFADLP